jgi:hypothetical protein
MTTALTGVRRWKWSLLAGLGVILSVLLWLSPAELTLGQTVKRVYLHGALVRTAIVLFIPSTPLAHPLQMPFGLSILLSKSSPLE